ncbi:hypothetical protein M513_11966, partial [Trichuris suis]
MKCYQRIMKVTLGSIALAVEAVSSKRVPLSDRILLTNNATSLSNSPFTTTATSERTSDVQVTTALGYRSTARTTDCLCNAKERTTTQVKVHCSESDLEDCKSNWRQKATYSENQTSPFKKSQALNLDIVHHTPSISTKLRGVVYHLLNSTGSRCTRSSPRLPLETARMVFCRREQRSSRLYSSDIFSLLERGNE